MQCQNESLADSPVDLAADLRREVREMLLAGKSDDDVRDFMTARYGDFILFRPRYSLRNAWLWGAPAVLLLWAHGVVACRAAAQHAARPPITSPWKRTATLMVTFVVLAAALTIAGVVAVTIPLLRPTPAGAPPARWAALAAAGTAGDRFSGALCQLE